MCFRLDRVRARVFFMRVSIWIKSSGGYFREISLFLPPHDSLSIISVLYQLFCSDMTRARFDKL